MPKHKSMKRNFSLMVKCEKLFSNFGEKIGNFPQRNFPMKKLFFPPEKCCSREKKSFKVENYRDKSMKQRIRKVQ